jgi:hypothetical protein
VKKHEKAIYIIAEVTARHVMVDMVFVMLKVHVTNPFIVKQTANTVMAIT